MNKIFILISFFLIFFSISKAEIVKEIKIDGNKRVSSETVKIYGKIELNKDYQEKDLNQILKDLYQTDFFEDVKVSIKNNVLILPSFIIFKFHFYFTI